MTLKIIYNHWYPKKFGLGAITLYPYILIADKKEDLSPTILKHELIHVEQIRRHGYWFYATYILKIFKNLTSQCLNGGDCYTSRCFWDAYYDNSFELEAYEREGEPFTKQEMAEIKPYV